ncbi:MAG: MobF family relaxase [Gemmatimonadota bacterium]
MFTTHKILIAAAVKIADYFTDIDARGDYYVGPDGDPWAQPGEWAGHEAAEALGIEGDVTRDALLAVLDGRHPVTGVRLKRTWGTRSQIAAHDPTCSTPSSVSSAWATGSEEQRARIQAAQDAAVEAMLRWGEEHLAAIRRRERSRRTDARGASPIVHETAAGWVAAVFRHHTSRQTHAQATIGDAPDPQLHTHVLVFLARGHNGEWYTPESRVLHKAQAQLGAVYRCALAAELAKQGFAIERRTGHDQHFFEIAGMPQELRDDWSSRTREVKELVAEWTEDFIDEFGREPTVEEQRRYAVTQRVAKGNWHRPDLLDRWQRQAGHHGMSASAIDALCATGPALPSAAEGRRRLVEDLLSPTGLTRHAATFDRTTLELRAYEWAAGLLEPEHTAAAIDDLLRRQEVSRLDEDVYTTAEMLRTEQAVVAWRDRRAELPLPAPPRERHLAEALLRAPVPPTDEQRTAIEEMLGNRTTFVTGEAGVGKGVAVGVAAAAWRGDGRRIFALAASGAQAQRFGADLGADVEWCTIDSFVERVRRGRISLSSRDVIVVDEAGQIDTRRWGQLTKAIGDEPTVVALGDHAQLTPIEAGGLWPLLSRDGPALTEVFRTRLDWEREAWSRLRRSDAEAALRLYARHGHLEIAGTRRQAIHAAVAAWEADGRTGLLLTDASNAERYRLNREAQARRWAAGELGQEVLTVEREHGPVGFHVGDSVQFVGMLALHEAPRIENRTTGEVIGIDSPERVVVVRTHERTPREIRVNVRQYSGLDLHYAMHVHTGQGATVDRTYAILGGWQTHKESMYVACSRAREGTRIFIDRQSLGRLDDAAAIEEAARRGARSRAKLAAISHRLSLPVRRARGTQRDRVRRRPLKVRSQRRERLLETLAEQRIVRQAWHLLGLRPGLGGRVPERTELAVPAAPEPPHGR